MKGDGEGMSGLWFSERHGRVKKGKGKRRQIKKKIICRNFSSWFPGEHISNTHVDLRLDQVPHNKLPHFTVPNGS